MLFLFAAATIAAATPAPMCAALAQSYEDASKALAMDWADDLGDNSVYRATNRKLDDLAALEKARLAADLMRDHHCTMPSEVPSASGYISPAMVCKSAQLKATGSEAIAECQRSTWNKVK